jgi:hypothetical protein
MIWASVALAYKYDIYVLRRLVEEYWMAAERCSEVLG